MSTCDPRFDVNSPNLCPSLRWKGQFILAAPDPDAQGGTDTNYWCKFTQNCIGPDGMTAEPGMCSSPFRECHGRCE